MRASDMDPQNQLAHYEQIRGVSERVDAMNADLAERAERRREDGSDYAEQQEHEERMRAAQPPAPAPAPRPRAPVAAPSPPIPAKFTRPRHDASGRIVEVEHFEGTGAEAARGWEGWIKRYVKNYVGDRLESFAATLGDEVGKDFRRERALAEERIAKSDQAVTELMMGLEARIAALEAQQQQQQRTASKPRLVAGGGSSDAA